MFFFCVDSLCTAVAQDNVQKTTLNDVRTVCVAKIFHECSPFLIISKLRANLLDKWMRIFRYSNKILL